jgi:predicted nucleotidyltransferase component of viral defense system
MAADRSLADSLVLKGGTPLNLCFGVPPRLSVDLDFNYIGAADRAVMLKARPNIVAALERLGRRAGYQVQRSAEDHAGQKFYVTGQDFRRIMEPATRLERVTC